MQIFVSGSLAYDRIMNFPGRFADHILPEKLHVLNVCFTVEGLQEKFGGTAGNIAYNLSLLGESPLILACAGRDFAAYRRHLEKLGLSLEGIRVVEEEFTAGAYITTDQDDNQITGFNPGAMKFPSHYRFPGLDPAQALAIISPGNLEDMIGYSRAYKEMQVPYICDPGQQIPVIPREDLAEMITGADILISNDYELEMIMGATGWDLAELCRRAGAVITTLGEQGSLVRQQGQEVSIPPVTPERVQDPTGAGDAFRAGLIKGLVLGRDLVQAARLGSTSASFALEHYGTQEHAYSQDQFWARHQAAFPGEAG